MDHQPKSKSESESESESARVSPSRSGRRAFLADVWRWTGLGLVAGGLVLVKRMLDGASPARPEVELSQVQLQQLETGGRLLLPGFFLRGSSREPYALRLRCTHLGCSLRHDAKRRRFDCPCHGSRFDEQGQVLAGPATQPLQRAEIRRLGKKLVLR